MRAQERRDWELFTDWCQSIGKVPLPASNELIGEFLSAFPGSSSAQGRRVRAIRLAHERAGMPLTLPTGERLSALREGPNWATVPRALAQLPTHRHRRDFHVALRGRRDAWIIVLVGVVGLTREEVRAIEQADITLFPSLSVKGFEIGMTPEPAECPACAVTRWLRVVGAASFGWTNEVKEILAPVDDSSAHDCRVGLDGIWRQAQTLLPHIDRHGWVSGVPLSARAISTVMAARQMPASLEEPARRAAPVVSTGRFADASRDELAAAYDDVDTKAAQILLQLQALIDESDEALDRIKVLRP